jgi:nucleoside recognition membrane protein YjiH
VHTHTALLAVTKNGFMVYDFIELLSCLSHRKTHFFGIREQSQENRAEPRNFSNSSQLAGSCGELMNLRKKTLVFFWRSIVCCVM